MERIWLKSYPPGVPADINPDEYKSLVELFETSIGKYGERPAFNNMGRTVRFAELDRMSRDFGAWLQARGLARGARVALMMPNCLQYPVAMFGVLRAGDTVVNVNPLYTARELEYQLRDSGAEAIVVLEHFAHVLQEVLARPPIRHIVVTSLPPLMGEERAVIITALPLYHIFSLTVNCLVMMVVGGENVLITNPRDIPGFVKELAKHRYSMISGVNTLFNALLNHPDFARLDFSGLRLAVGGGMAVQKAVAERWKQVTGSPIIEGYGLTEPAPSAPANPLNVTTFTGAIGVPMPSTEVVLRDDDNRDLPLGQAGEICIRGPQVMAGYWQRPAETAEVLGRDGFLHTGDIGVMDEKGFIRVVDRKKDMIVVSGFKVFPNEIEQVVAMLPGVLECAVIGVPDEHSGEVPKVFVVKRDPQLTEQDVLEHCRKELTGYKRPKYVEFRAELPKTNVGKILRRALRDEKKAA